MLRRLALRDFVIVTTLEVELSDGFSVLTGETGAGKSILVDAVQLALGSRGDAGVVREGAARTEITAEFDAPASLLAWLDAAGFEGADTLLLRRVIDAQGKSRAWVNGSPATVAQLREAADHLVDIHGQHAWQSLTRPAAVRGLLDAYAGVDTDPLTATWGAWKAASDALDKARTQQADLERERERLAWQVNEVSKLAPGADEWDELNAEHGRLSNAQALMDAARTALDALSEADTSADGLTGRATDALESVAEHDARLAEVVEVLQSAQAQLQDAAHTLSSYLNHADLHPERLQELDERLSAWMSLAKRYRRPPAELPATLLQWKDELAALDAASDLAALEARVKTTKTAFDTEAKRISATRRAAAPKLSQAVTAAMQQLGMAGGMFEVSLLKQDSPQSYGLESAEFLVAGHAGSTPRPMAKVASGGELSRIALAIAVTTSQLAPHGEAAGTLIFDEVDAGVGGAVADTVGRLMKQLGRDRQVMAVTHLPQVAACADHHFVVAKAAHEGRTRSDITPVHGETRVAEIARMLGGERLSSTSLAHAQELLSVAATPTSARSRKRP
ncbi:DNA repair protein RecN [Rhizobacter sp. Root1221]|uniref:DNA repair protein RecN n=1 Tax=Rhizobacter sp. Root1221 TaxID=1736433 RepID=UPI0006F78872|nr:DNA repair protein RecN [Rhizobacter sp. Root1221]KQV99940.1 DNA repair protein RecN [Rhizobacter sp. Root1221]